jgi:hypothetical protein
MYSAKPVFTSFLKDLTQHKGTHNATPALKWADWIRNLLLVFYQEMM